MKILPRPKKWSAPNRWAYSFLLVFPIARSKKFGAILYLRKLKRKYIWGGGAEGREWGGLQRQEAYGAATGQAGPLGAEGHLCLIPTLSPSSSNSETCGQGLKLWVVFLS